MNKKFLIGIAVIFMIAMVSIGAVLSYRGEAGTTTACQNDGNCFGKGTCDGNCDGDCDQSNCQGTCPERASRQQRIRSCSM